MYGFRHPWEHGDDHHGHGDGGGHDDVAHGHSSGGGLEGLEKFNAKATIQAEVDDDDDDDEDDDE